MGVVAVAEVGGFGVVGERLEAFAADVLAEAMNRPVQLVNGGLYLRGLLEDGSRKSLEPLVARLGGEADYQSVQQFLADSPWDPALVVKATAERVTSRIDVQAWVLDDTGFPKDGKRSPGVKRQYSGTLGKIGNCQIGVSVHAVGRGEQCRWVTCPGTGARIPSVAGRQDPRRGRFQDQARTRYRAGGARLRLGDTSRPSARRSGLWR